MNRSNPARPFPKYRIKYNPMLLTWECRTPEGHVHGFHEFAYAIRFVDYHIAAHGGRSYYW